MNSSASPDLAAPRQNEQTIAHALDALAGGDGDIGVAVSGGSDSLALLLHASAWARAHKRALYAVTVDHGLRPEAAEEAAQVASICASLKIPHDTLTWRPTSNKVAQSTARAARYRLLADWSARHGLGSICIGHTQDDRLETFLIRARAGSTWYGLAGPMPAAPAPIATDHGLRLLRPMLTIRRADLRLDLQASGVDWIDDPTNLSHRHERIRMRALLQATSTETQNAILRSMNRFAEMRAATLNPARTTLEQHVRFGADRSATIPNVLAQLPEQARLRLMEAIILALVPRDAPLRADRLARLCDKLCDPDVQRCRATLAGCWFRKDHSALHISPAPPRKTQKSVIQPTFDPFLRAALLLMDPQVKLLNHSGRMRVS